jgi:hypothetical protein
VEAGERRGAPLMVLGRLLSSRRGVRRERGRRDVVEHVGRDAVRVRGRRRERRGRGASGGRRGVLVRPWVRARGEQGRVCAQAVAAGDTAARGEACTAGRRARPATSGAARGARAGRARLGRGGVVLEPEAGQAQPGARVRESSRGGGVAEQHSGAEEGKRRREGKEERRERKKEKGKRGKEMGERKRKEKEKGKNRIKKGGRRLRRR